MVHFSIHFLYQIWFSSLLIHLLSWWNRRVEWLCLWSSSSIAIWLHFVVRKILLLLEQATLVVHRPDHGCYLWQFPFIRLFFIAPNCCDQELFAWTSWPDCQNQHHQSIESHFLMMEVPVYLSSTFDFMNPFSRTSGRLRSSLACLLISIFEVWLFTAWAESSQGCFQRQCLVAWSRLILLGYSGIPRRFPVWIVAYQLLGYLQSSWFWLIWGCCFDPWAHQISERGSRSDVLKTNSPNRSTAAFAARCPTWTARAPTWYCLFPQCCTTWTSSSASQVWLSSLAWVSITFWSWVSQHQHHPSASHSNVLYCALSSSRAIHRCLNLLDSSLCLSWRSACFQMLDLTGCDV